ncbi:hypothetical protein GCM10023094_31460 [Rhodococcus olei]|uniref:Uncharacterized protein n=1 Tax=Rhodococcus olei TaxID=2161675 RepID=A0ABP8P5E3_9NOCA
MRQRFACAREVVELAALLREPDLPFDPRLERDVPRLALGHCPIVLPDVTGGSHRVAGLRVSRPSAVNTHIASGAAACGGRWVALGASRVNRSVRRIIQYRC